MQRLVEETADLKTAAARFTFFTRVVAETAAKKSFLEPLTTAGVDLEAAAEGSRRELTAALDALLVRAATGWAVRDDVHLEKVMGVLIGASMATEYTGWSRDAQTRALTIIFDGLRPRND